MNSRRNAAIRTIAFLVLLAPGTASALSCARPSLDAAAVQGAVAIFEGTAGQKRDLSRREAAVISRTAIQGKVAGTPHLKVYAFTVTKGWKGTTTEQRVEVLFNAYWGDGFAAGQDYLVVISQRVGALLWAPLCGHTVELDHAEKMGDLGRLERLVGAGHHMKIRFEDRACRRDADCTLIQTHCGDCSCGTPVTAAKAEGYRARFMRLCAMIRVAERCEMACAAVEPTCRDGLCVDY